MQKETGVTNSKWLCFFQKIAGVDFVYFIQVNSLDRRNRALKIEAYNESFATRVIIHEVCNYFVSSPLKTIGTTCGMHNFHAPSRL